ncbi:4-carboxy-4-hydroxy-2-oxoadipate aldolase/oxaloacetate decarboxylase [Mesorhizobium shangrilense]|uniref:4-carboxy-4-hydroxy-2-oxoadipate aldolase/oxaloacetate decarboxylase n=1 Tax=Mesorhizobium shangrilense TaxID=460060 RepID=A0ABV2DGV5_9HYPH
MGVVIRNVPRPDATLVRQLATFGTATVHEAQGRSGMLFSYLRPIFSGSRIAGPAVTVDVPPGDNWMIHVAVEQCRQGDVLVVRPSAPCDAGYVGDLLATSLIARGVAGLVIDAGCRDVAEISEIGFPIWSKAVSAQGTVKETLGSVNVPIVCAGAYVRPGDVIVADDDGVVVVAQTRIAKTVESSRVRVEKEAKSRVRLQAGELGLDMYGMRQKLAEMGLVYRDYDPGKDGL